MLEVATLRLLADGSLFESDQKLTEATRNLLAALELIMAQSPLWSLEVTQTFVEFDDPEED